jgi:PAS domain S-box-containing protein
MPRRSEIFGYTPEEAIGRSITMHFPPELRDAEIDILRRSCELASASNT